MCDDQVTLVLDSETQVSRSKLVSKSAFFAKLFAPEWAQEKLKIEIPCDIKPRAVEKASLLIPRLTVRFYVGSTKMAASLQKLMNCWNF
jgi:hypothetical protein